MLLSANLQQGPNEYAVHSPAIAAFAIVCLFKDSLRATCNPHFC
jgi:hypothetical protein